MRLYIICCIAIWAYAVSQSALKMDKYQQQEAVYWHNKARSEIAKAGLCANMLEMTWNDGVADAAANNPCPSLQHHNDKAENAYGATLGENIAGSWGQCTNGGLCREAGICGKNGAPECETNCKEYCTLKSVIYESWYLNEKEGNNCKPSDSGGGHCSQVVWPDSTEVGCTYQKGCPEWDVTVACNYNPPGNDIPDPSKVYLGKCEKGPACSACPQGYSCNEIGLLCSKNAGGSGPSNTSPTRRPTRRPITTNTSPTRRPTRRPITTNTSPTRRPTRRPITTNTSPTRRPTRRPITTNTSPTRRPTRRPITTTCTCPTGQYATTCSGTSKVCSNCEPCGTGYYRIFCANTSPGYCAGCFSNRLMTCTYKVETGCKCEPTQAIEDPDTDTDTDTDTSKGNSKGKGNSTSSEGKSQGKGKGKGKGKDFYLGSALQAILGADDKGCPSRNLESDKKCEKSLKKCKSLRFQARCAKSCCSLSSGGDEPTDGPIDETVEPVEEPVEPVEEPEPVVQCILEKMDAISEGNAEEDGDPKIVLCESTATDGLFYSLTGDIDTFLQSANKDLVSHVTIIEAPQSAVVNQFSINVDQSGVTVSQFEMIAEAMSSRYFGTKTVLVVIVEDSEGNKPQLSQSQYARYIFTDTHNLKTYFEACSKNQIRIVPAQAGTGGVITVKVQQKLQNVLWSEAGSLAADLIPRNIYRTHVMFMLPRNVDMQGAAGWGSRPGSTSWYGKENGKKPAVLVHEFGHNLGMEHSGADDKEYGDPTCYMGNLGVWDEVGTKKCFNAAKTWASGWYSNLHATYDGKQSTYGARLVGIDDAATNQVSSGKKLLLRILSIGDETKEYYLMYNRAVGINAGSTTHGNKIVIVQSPRNNPQGQTWVHATLGADEQTTLFKSFTVKVCSSGETTAKVRVCNSGSCECSGSWDFEEAPTSSPPSSPPTGFTRTCPSLFRKTCEYRREKDVCICWKNDKEREVKRAESIVSSRGKGNRTSSEGKSKGKGNGNVTFEVSAITDSDDSDFSDNDDESPDAVLGEVVLAAAPSQFQVVLPCFIVVVLTLLQLL